MCSDPYVSEQLANNLSLKELVLQSAEWNTSNEALEILAKYIPSQDIFHFFSMPKTSDGVSLLDKTMREGNVERVNLVIALGERAEVVAHPEVFISQDTIEGCLANSEFQKIVELPLKEIVFPLNLSQSFVTPI